MDLGLGGEYALRVTFEDVERCPGDEVVFGVERDVVSAFAFICDAAVEGVRG